MIRFLNIYLTKKNVILILVTLGVLFFLSVNISPKTVSYTIYYLLNPEKSISCYRSQANSLQDISEVKPTPGRSIFFHETSCSSYRNGKIVINSRQACAVESAALTNPNYDVFLLYTSPGLIKFENTQSDRYLHALLSYKNVRILHLDYSKYTNNTPLEDLYKYGKIESSSFPQSHASDVLRYLTLFKYGGIYLDLDVIVVKSLEDLEPNYAGVESEWNVAAGILNFAPYGLGKYYARQCVMDLRHNFDGNDWGTNGPGVITRLMRGLCDTEKAIEMIGKDCNGFKAVAPKYFYPVRWQNWSMYFDEVYTETVRELTKESYVIHVWNQHSQTVRLDKNANVPYANFARKYCPKVYQECDKYL